MKRILVLLFWWSYNEGNGSPRWNAYTSFIPGMPVAFRSLTASGGEEWFY